VPPAVLRAAELPANADEAINAKPSTTIASRRVRVRPISTSFLCRKAGRAGGTEALKFGRILSR
jgi:hypothetical protein